MDDARAAESRDRERAKELKALDGDTLAAMLRESPVPYVSVWQPQLWEPSWFRRVVLRRRPPRQIAVRGWVLPVPAEAYRAPPHEGKQRFQHTVVMVDEFGPAGQYPPSGWYNFKRGQIVGAVLAADGSLELMGWHLITDPVAVADFVLRATRQA